MNKVIIFFCFELKSVDNEIIVKLINSLRFSPKVIEAEALSKGPIKFKKDVHLDKILNSEKIEDLELTIDGKFDKPSFHIIRIERKEVQVIMWEAPIDLTPPISELEELCSINGFNAAYCVDKDDWFWQSTDSINTYESRKKDHSNLPKIIDKDFGREKIDISKNPGRKYLFPGMWLMSCYQMWFGEYFFQFVPKERFLAFPYANKIRELESGTVFIELYENPHECDKKENREIQAAFREWVGMDELEKKGPEIQNKLYGSDPIFEINTKGDFKRGGAQLLVTWMDENNKPISKSKASKKKIVETTIKGKILCEEEFDVKPGKSAKKLTDSGPISPPQKTCSFLRRIFKK